MYIHIYIYIYVYTYSYRYSEMQKCYWIKWKLPYILWWLPLNSFYLEQAAIQFLEIHSVSSPEGSWVFQTTNVVISPAMPSRSSLASRCRINRASKLGKDLRYGWWPLSEIVIYIYNYTYIYIYTYIDQAACQIQRITSRWRGLRGPLLADGLQPRQQGARKKAPWPGVLWLERWRRRPRSLGFGHGNDKQIMKGVIF